MWLVFETGPNIGPEKRIIPLGRLGSMEMVPDEPQLIGNGIAQYLLEKYKNIKVCDVGEVIQEVIQEIVIDNVEKEIEGEVDS